MVKICFGSLLPVLMLTLLSCQGSPTKSTIPHPESDSTANLVADNEHLYAILVSKKNELVLEQYFNNRTQDSLCDIQSLTKGLMSILIGIAVDKRYINSVEEPIETYFPERFEAFADEKKKKITVRHLLNQTSGLSWKGYLEHEDWLASQDQIAYVLDKELEHPPGEVYNYNSGATHLLSAIISKAAGQSTLEFANDHLFRDLDIVEVDWQIRNDGNYDGSGLGLKMKPIDLMKIGQLLMNGGKWTSQKIVSQHWVEKLFDESEKANTDWGINDSKHGFCWYKAQFNGETIDYGMGYGGQFIFLIAEKELVIVTTHNHDLPNGIEQQIGFIHKVLPGLIKTYGN